MTEARDFIELLDRMKTIALSKNADYAGETDFLKNFKVAKELGVLPSLGVAIRLSDKWSRVCQLVQKEQPAVVEESLEDTLIDMANYALLMVLCLREEKEERQSSVKDEAVQDFIDDQKEISEKREQERQAIKKDVEEKARQWVA